ncbi:NADH dehydrogenase 1 beta subcomplex subunit 10-B [Obelidium mucronatum]|nr:NADH dehydrogenase 1 beta subcomplex subunit 10-B [Obelidium mucronatum]
MADPVKISPLPVIDKDLDKMDHMSFVKARSDFYKEQLVRTEEVNFLREKMKWCYRREGVNHLQNCRHLTMQYLELVRAAKLGWVEPFKLPAQTVKLDAADE